jgi:hypothetical protein
MLSYIIGKAKRAKTDFEDYHIRYKLHKVMLWYKEA